MRGQRCLLLDMDLQGCSSGNAGSRFVTVIQGGYVRGEPGAAEPKDADRSLMPMVSSEAPV